MTARELIAEQIKCMVKAIGLDEVFNVLVEVQSERLDLGRAHVPAPAPPAEIPPAAGAAHHANGDDEHKSNRGQMVRFLRYLDQYPLDTVLSREHCYRWMVNEFGTKAPYGIVNSARTPGYIVEDGTDQFKLTGKGRKRARDLRTVATVSGGSRR